MVENMTYGTDYHYIPVTSIQSGSFQLIAPEVWTLTVQIVNVVFIGTQDKSRWILVDAGMPGSADSILKAVNERFGEGSRPTAILLTHGHFDHVGSIVELAGRWDVPVMAHPQELPYLTGRLAYPPGDPTVSSGLLAKLSPWYPNEPIDLGSRVNALPEDESIPGMPGWEWIHTPGHTPGHVSLFRKADRVLIAGDAFVTVKQESLYSVLTQELEIGGPPQYFTMNWQEASDSVKKLEALRPTVAVTGHGKPANEEWLGVHLKRLADEFERIAVPGRGH